jgi:hypothetical protein
MKLRHDWEHDKRDFSTCLKEWAQQVGSRQQAADELRVPINSLNMWCAGRTCEREQSLRRLMTLIRV